MAKRLTRGDIPSGDEANNWLDRGLGAFTRPFELFMPCEPSFQFFFHFTTDFSYKYDSLCSFILHEEVEGIGHACARVKVAAQTEDCGLAYVFARGRGFVREGTGP